MIRVAARFFLQTLLFKIMNAQQQIQEPAILTANTYFWSPGSIAGTRRRNEAQQFSIVASFFEAIGMKVTRTGHSVIGQKDDIVAEFQYRETCSTVYKSLEVVRNGKRSNIITLRKLYSAAAAQ